MYIVLIILTLICALLLICVVLVQKSKGGGLSSSFAGSNQIMGVRRTICLLSILATFTMPKAINASSSRVNAAPAEQAVPADFNTEVPAAPVAAPAPAADQAPAQAPAAEEAPAE